MMERRNALVPALFKDFLWMIGEEPIDRSLQNHRIMYTMVVLAPVVLAPDVLLLPLFPPTCRISPLVMVNPNPSTSSRLIIVMYLQR
jgi:hypothetical protein